MVGNWYKHGITLYSRSGCTKASKLEPQLVQIGVDSLKAIITVLYKIWK